MGFTDTHIFVANRIPPHLLPLPFVELFVEIFLPQRFFFNLLDHFIYEIL